MCFLEEKMPGTQMTEAESYISPDGDKKVKFSP
jgi:hypothetical protein